MADSDSREKSSSKTRTKSGKKIVDLSEFRKSKHEEVRRDYERILFNRVLGVYSFAERVGVHHIEVVDLSQTGLRFREQSPEVPFQPGQKIALRFYFTPTSFLRVIVDVLRATPYKDSGRSGFEYGCRIDAETKSAEVVRQLVTFMHSYADLACQDSSPPLLWF